VAKGNQAKKANGGGAEGSKSAPAEAAAPAAINEAGGAGAPAQLDPEIAKKLATVRSQVRESFGKVVMALMMTPRYRSQTLGDLQHLVLEPLIRDRVAIAYPGNPDDAALADMAGFAIWASVSDDVDQRIREQVANGVFPIRLRPEDWTSGKNYWLFDVIAADRRATTSVLANFKQVVKEGSLKLHPLIARLIDAETLTKMGAHKVEAVQSAA